jgi:hypothetical protein
MFRVPRFSWHLLKTVHSIRTIFFGQYLSCSQLRSIIHQTQDMKLDSCILSLRISNQLTQLPHQAGNLRAVNRCKCPKVTVTSQLTCCAKTATHRSHRPNSSLMQSTVGLNPKLMCIQTLQRLTTQVASSRKSSI